MKTFKFPEASSLLVGFPLVGELLSRIFSEGGRAYVIGGFIRDLYLEKGDFADIDMAVTVSQDILDQMMPLLFTPEEMSRNAFGYLRVKREDFELDIWPLESSWYFKNVDPYRGDPHEILDSTFSSLDEIYYDFTEGVVVMSGAFERAVTDKVLFYDMGKAYNMTKALEKLGRQIVRYDIKEVYIKCGKE